MVIRMPNCILTNIKSTCDRFRSTNCCFERLSIWILRPILFSISFVFLKIHFSKKSNIVSWSIKFCCWIWYYTWRWIQVFCRFTFQFEFTRYLFSERITSLLCLPVASSTKRYNHQKESIFKSYIFLYIDRLLNGLVLSLDLLRVTFECIPM